MSERKRAKRKTAIAQRLIALRNRLGLTQKEASEKADIPLRTWINWENGRNPSRYAIDRLKRTFPSDF